eukprot:Rhum_TRINITY_DN23314_c0_g1::Rhum_TRINITY_DN23314_c0_g1_i1::g.177702::m.177702
MSAMISAGKSHCLAVLEDGSVSGWGHNGWGRSTCKWPPQLGGRAIEVAAGATHSIALLEDGQVVGWGHNLQGQCDAPERVSAEGARSVCAGTAYSAALLHSGDVATWGTPDLTPPAGLHKVRQLAAGALHCLALKEDDSVVAWGRNAHGEASIPPVLKDKRVVCVSANAHRSVAVLDNGELHAWGAHSYGGVYDCPKGIAAVSVACGARHTVAVTADGSMVVWGDNDKGQCDVPPVASGAKVVAVQAGEYHSIAALSTGEVLCWGDTQHGQTQPPCFNNLRVLSTPSLHFRQEHKGCLVLFLLWQRRLSQASSKLDKCKTGSINRRLPRELYALISQFVLPRLVVKTPSPASLHLTSSDQLLKGARHSSSGTLYSQNGSKVGHVTPSAVRPRTSSPNGQTCCVQ